MQAIGLAKLRLHADVLRKHLGERAYHVAAEATRVEDGREREQVEERRAVAAVVAQRDVHRLVRPNRLAYHLHRRRVGRLALQEAAAAADDVGGLVPSEQLEGGVDAGDRHAGQRHVADDDGDEERAARGEE